MHLPGVVRGSARLPGGGRGRAARAETQILRAIAEGQRIREQAAAVAVLAALVGRVAAPLLTGQRV